MMLKLTLYSPKVDDIGVRLASGSFNRDGMIEAGIKQIVANSNTLVTRFLREVSKTR